MRGDSASHDMWKKMSISDTDENGNFGNKGQINQLRLQSQPASNMEVKAIPNSQSHADTNRHQHTLASLC